MKSLILGRKRKSGHGLPPYVYKGKSAYEWRLRDPGMKTKCIRLCSLNEPISAVWKAWEDAQSRPSFTLGWLLREYEKSAQFKGDDPSVNALKRKKNYINKILGYQRGNSKTLESAPLDKITPGVIRKYLDARAADNAAVSGNREKAMISAAWNWAIERDMVKWDNPCKSVKRNTEKARDRYVTDKEYGIVYNLALNSSTPYIAVAMEMAYLCRMRKSEILSATKSQILDDGFDTVRSKGSMDNITGWTPRLRDAINLALSQHKDKDSSTHIVCNTQGQKVTEYAFNSAWQRLKKDMKNAGVDLFTFHDLRAKSISDFKGDKRAASGHRTEAMVAIYDRKKKVVEATR